LLKQLGPYFPEAHNQVITPSPFLRDIEPSPWEALSHSLTSAVLVIGINHAELRDSALGKTADYLDICHYTVTNLPPIQTEDSPEEADVLSIATITVSLLGFLEAAATHANFWTGSERLYLVERIRKILTEKFLVSVETAFSTVRNATHLSGRALREWKRYAKHYAGIGRPLGAMLLQQGFMRLLVSTTSLLIADSSVLQGEDILDVLMSGQVIAKTSLPWSEDSELGTIETLVDIAAEEMALLEDGADYLQLGTSWQQRLAFAVKAYVLTSYVNCVILNEGAADADVLMAWLEDTMSDPIEMADENLASVVLKCMAILARVSPTFASSLSRSLPRFIVKGGLRQQTVSVAANCLAYVLQFLSQDAVITTLYTLGNVLSSGSGERAPVAGSTPDGTLKVHPGRGDFASYDRQDSGSAISLALSGEEETATIYGNVVQAIVVVSSTCKDDKIMALVQSMLIQKIGKVSPAVDARILTDGVALAAHGGQNEFRSLLKLLLRLGHIGVVQNDALILNAVSPIAKLYPWMAFYMGSTKADQKLGDESKEPLVCNTSKGLPAI
jgi:phosphatidylinositol 4-kinase A